MRAILIQQGLDAALEDDEDSKAKQRKEEGSSSSGADMKTINNKAHNTIILHLSDEVLREVAKEKTASGLWTKLKELFLKKSLAKRLSMKRKLYMFSMKDGTALKDHLDEFKKLILGHYIKDCFEKKKLEKLQKESNGKAAIASEDEGMSDDADVLIAAEKQSSGEWILDSGCSFHMCHNKNFFKTFDNIAGGKVLLGNNLACNVAGIGTINIRMFDGIERDLKQIEENDMIIMKGIRRIWLYVLVGSTIMTTITTSVSSDRTKLWHMSSDFEKFCKSKGIARHRTVRNTPQQNDLAERMNMTLIEKGKIESRAVKGYFIRYPEGIKGKTLVGCKWIFKLNEGVSGGEPVRYEAKLVAKGFIQKEEIDFNEVFSPVVKHSSIRVLLAITTFFELELNQMDVKTAFLHGNLKKEILMAQPEGFIEEGTEDMVCLLKKRSEYDSCVYFRKLNSGDQISLLLYVDDMLITCKHIADIEKLKNELMAVFEIRDLGPTARILGMQIKRHSHAKTLFLTQSGYLKKVVSRFGMLNLKLVSTPLAAHFKLSKQQELEEDAYIDHIRRIPYSGTVGSIMYAMVCTRPDVAYVIGLVSRFMGNPGKEHWEAKWLLRYLKGTEEHGVMFVQVDNASSKVLGYVDYDFAGDLDKRRLVTGLVFTLCGGVVSWKSTLQLVVAFSTTEAEYIALTEAVKEALWLNGDEIRNGVIIVIKIPSEVNPADMLTKPLSTVKFRNSLNLIGIVNLYYNNAFYAKVGGISMIEMNLLEVDFLFALGFQLMVCLLVGLENENEGLRMKPMFT
ncbi:hypothetical protein KPL71_025836 [Citrus sinensis]|uniref:Uncharacterized protein n=1 Tax=Citrus sinensis TaxID=2711 RepID=A0ACB8HVH4_CITSI|nr:hypothetical protein KPL71_025836 [Citrus sinensis]